MTTPTAADIAARVDAGLTVDFARSRLKQILATLGGAVMLPVSFLFTDAGDPFVRVVGWAGVVLFGVALIAGGWATVVPDKPALTFDPDGVRVGQGLFYMRAGWDDIDGAYLATLPVRARFGLMINTRAAVIELTPGAQAVTTSRTTAPRSTPPDARSAHRRPDGSTPEGFLIQIPDVVAGLSQADAAALVDAVVAARRQRLA